MQMSSVVAAEGYRFCVDTHTTGFVVKGCMWTGTACKTGETVLTLNTKGLMKQTIFSKCQK